MSLLLQDLRWDAGEHGDLRLRRGRIAELGRLRRRRGERALELGGARVLPGLWNAHDHLDLDLLPRLGAPPYRSLAHFASEIYRPDEPPIRDVLRVAKRDRLLWGGYRNLIGGATTVVHHDPWSRHFRFRFPVRVVRRYGWSHSLAFGRDPPREHARSRGRPFLIHAAEGVDEASYRELDRLDAAGILAAGTVLVHGVALTAAQRERLAESGASLVWCPASNRYLFGVTAPIGELAGRVPIALGTDSTLTGSPTLLDEARAAHATGLASAAEILEMVTAGAARIFGARPPRIRPGAAADLVVLPERGGAAASLLAARPRDLALVTIAGRPRLARPELAAALGREANARIDGARRWLWGDVAGLRRRIARAAGREVAARGPLWPLLRGRYE